MKTILIIAILALTSCASVHVVPMKSPEFRFAPSAKAENIKVIKDTVAEMKEATRNVIIVGTLP